MKTSSLIVFTAITLIGMGAASADPSKRTARHVKGNAASLLGERVSVDVSFVQPLRRLDSKDFAVFTVHTWDDREEIPGGTIPAVMPADEAARFASRYETSPDVDARRLRGISLDTRRLSGTLAETSRKVLYLDLTGGAAAKANFDVAGGPAASENGRPGIKRRPFRRP